MLTFLDIYNECAGQPWSMFDNEAASKEDFESAMKISINKASSYLWNLREWSFRFTKKDLKTKVNVTEYSMPNGVLLKKTVGGVERYGVKYNGKYLPYDANYELMDEEPGEPEGFYTDGDKLVLYPSPDNSYILTLLYFKLPFAVSSAGELLYEMSEDTDYINISAKYEKLFKNCLISLAMMYAIAEETDENYSAYKKQYEDSLKVLEKYCKDSIVNKRITW